VATIPFNEGGVHVIDLATGRDRAFTAPQAIAVKKLLFSPDSKQLAAGDDEGTIHLVDVAAMQDQGRLSGNAMPTLELAFSSDGTFLAALKGIANQGERQVEIWQLATRQRRDLPQLSPSSIAFAPVGNLFGAQDLDGTVSLWDPSDGTRRARYGGGGMVSSLMQRMVFSPDGTTFVMVTPNRLVHVRDVATGQIRATLRGHTNNAPAAAFAPDGRMLATGTIAPFDEGDEPGRAEVGIWVRSK
jgi:WD40 repeat protein